MKSVTMIYRAKFKSARLCWLSGAIFLILMIGLAGKYCLSSLEKSNPIKITDSRPIVDRTRPRPKNKLAQIELNSAEIKNSLQAMGSDELMNQKTQHLIYLWAKAYPAEAREWVMSIKNPQLRQPIAQHVALGMAETNPREAAGFVINDFLPGNQQDESLVVVVGAWAKHEPEVVAEWIKEFPHDTMGGNAIGALISSWMKQDTQAAGDWLTSLPPSGLKNSGLVPYINYLRCFDEKRAEAFVQMIQN